MLDRVNRIDCITNWTEEMDRALIEAADHVARDYRDFASAWEAAHDLVYKRTGKYRSRSACMRRFQAIVRESELAYAGARRAISIQNAAKRERLAARRD